ncbi:3-phosphoglycerate dehydrogenase [Pusillimonas sp. TS35]|uniref:hydroxyacid dehydrogenase n=1 Tax=Paracandidimonas lactea TaxID=2895524 RepID=UPI00136842F0|nr:hydroxyacid dehydrogenase [Paracandidimonas lactea]MYN14323.1 3-phosphoglycerate dehydrogenase [Pusillimonas sp. TS35]
MNKIIIAEFMDSAAVESLRARFDVHYDSQLHENREALIHAIHDADGLIVRNRTRVDQALLSQPHRLRAVGRLGVGLDNIDTAACGERGIAVFPATGANANTVAEYVICCAMMLLRRAYTVTGAVAAGQWPRDALVNGQEIGGKTLGIIGLGSVGGRTAELAQAMGMTVMAYDPSPAARADTLNTVVRSPSVDAVLAGADVVSLHVPLTAATKNLIGATQLNAMKPGAILINVARGGVVDEAALATSLKDGHLGGAAIDVYAHEPLPAGSALADAPNLILTPHIAGVTLESNMRVSAMIAERVSQHLLSNSTGDKP